MKLSRASLLAALLPFALVACDGDVARNDIVLAKQKPDKLKGSCAEANGGCDGNAACTQVKSNEVACACRPGFAGDGLTCADVDECATDNGGCHADATCSNTVGGRTCTCPAWAEGDGVSCAMLPVDVTWNFESVDFGVGTRGEPGPTITFTLTNHAATPTPPLAIFFTEPGAEVFIEPTYPINDCRGRSLAPGATCSFDVRFAPSAVTTPGPKTALLTAAWRGPTWASVRLNATVQSLEVSPRQHDFGIVAQGAIARRSVVVTNVGPTPTEPLFVFFDENQGAAFTSDGGCRDRSLAPGESCETVVEFMASPFVTPGLKHGRLQIGPGGDRNVSVAFAGTVTPVCASLAPASWWTGESNPNDRVGSWHGTRAASAPYLPGKVGHAFDFSTSEDHVAIGDLDLGAQFSIEAWVNPQPSSTDAYIAAKGEGTDHSYYFSIEPAGTLVASVRNAAGAYTQYRTTPAVAYGEWQHVAAVYDGGAGADGHFRIYRNGEPLPTTVVGGYDAGGTPENKDFLLRLGTLAQDPSYSFRGGIDELAVFTRALSLAEVARIHAADRAGKCAP